MSTNAFDFLWKTTEPTATATKLPESGGVSGFAGQWTCNVVYRFWSAEKLEDYGQSYAAKRATNSGAFYYFHTQEAASVAGKAVGQEYPPNTIWRWETPVSTIVNIMDEETRGRFGDVITQEVNIATLMSKKQRHELHMITLPSAVQALAIFGGLISSKVFDYESLRVDHDVIDDAYQARVIGNGDAGYENSELWQARIALWKALGENNAKAYTLNQGKFDAKGEALRMCLNIIYQPTTLWARLVTVPDPRVDATYGDEGKRLTLPIVAQIWKDKADMMKTLEIEDKPAVAHVNGNGSNGSAAKVVQPASNGMNGNGLHVPAAWAGYVEDWKNYVREVIKPFAGKPQPVIASELKKMDNELQQNYSATADEFIAWIGAV